MTRALQKATILPAVAAAPQAATETRTDFDPRRQSVSSSRRAFGGLGRLSPGIKRAPNASASALRLGPGRLLSGPYRVCRPLAGRSILHPPFSAGGGSRRRESRLRNPSPATAGFVAQRSAGKSGRADHGLPALLADHGGDRVPSCGQLTRKSAHSCRQPQTRDRLAMRAARCDSPPPPLNLPGRCRRRRHMRLGLVV